MSSFRMQETPLINYVNCYNYYKLMKMLVSEILK